MRAVIPRRQCSFRSYEQIYNWQPLLPITHNHEVQPERYAGFIALFYLDFLNYTH